MTIREKFNDYVAKIPLVGDALTTEINGRPLTALLTVMAIGATAAGGCKEPPKDPLPLLKVKEYVPEKTIKAEEGRYSVNVSGVDAAYIVERLDDGVIRDKVVFSSPEKGAIVIEGFQGQGMANVYINGERHEGKNLPGDLFASYDLKLSTARKEVLEKGDSKKRETLENALNSISPK